MFTSALWAFLLNFFWFSYLYADDLHSAVFLMDLPYSMVATCKKSTNRGGIKCHIIYKKITFRVGTKTKQSEDQVGTLANMVGQVGSSGGLLLPLVIIAPSLFSDYHFEKQSIQALEAVKSQAGDATYEVIDVMYNGDEVGSFKTDDNGMISLDQNMDGVYTFVGYSRKFGIAINQDILISEEE